jgi:hypothetical protein
MLTRLIVVAALSGWYPAVAAAGEAPGRDASTNEATAPEDSTAGALQADGPRVTGKGPRHPQRFTPEQVIDERVRRLATSLDLDETQQSRLREVLENERREIRKLRTNNPHPEADRVGPMLAILERTREEIRAMLNEEQRKKYPAPLPHGSTAPANADLDHWMKLTQPLPPQGAEQGH